MERVYQTPSAAYVGTLEDLTLFGVRRGSRVGLMRELIGYSMVIRNPEAVGRLYLDQQRGLNPAIGAVEALQLLGQVTLPEVHTDRVKVFAQWLDDGVFLGAYGQRVHGQLGKLVRELERENSRQAVLTIYDTKQDLGADSADIPCTLSLQFFARGNELHMRTTMRSNDAWRGLPYDLTQFITLQAAVAADLGLSVGVYQHSVGSMHLYDTDYGRALTVSRGEAADEEPSNDLLFPRGVDIARLSSWARRALVNPLRLDPNETKHMTWLRQAMIPKEPTNG